MGRAMRVAAAGEAYHIFTRGSNKLRIFFDIADYEVFLLHLGRIAAHYGWRVYAYCLMPNHYHLLIEISEAGLSDGMRDLNGGFSRRTSKKYGRTAHLFKNRFGSRWIADESAYLEAARYVVLNPVRAGLCQDPAEWLWSSYAATVGDDPAPDWLDVGGLLAHFEVFAPGRRRDGYRRFVQHGIEAAPGDERSTAHDVRTAPAFELPF